MKIGGFVGMIMGFGVAANVIQDPSVVQLAVGTVIGIGVGVAAGYFVALLIDLLAIGLLAISQGPIGMFLQQVILRTDPPPSSPTQSPDISGEVWIGDLLVEVVLLVV